MDVHIKCGRTHKIDLSYLIRNHRWYVLYLQKNRHVIKLLLININYKISKEKIEDVK